MKNKDEIGGEKIYNIYLYYIFI